MTVKEVLASKIEKKITELFVDLDQLESASLPFRKCAHKNTVALSFILNDLSDDKLEMRDYSYSILEKLINTDLIQSKEEKCLASSLEVLYKTIIVLYMSYLPKYQAELYGTVKQLIEAYPEFHYDINVESDLWYDLRKEASRMKKKRVVKNIECEVMSQYTTEMEKLLMFRNFMHLALVAIPAEGNKNLLLKITAKLEGAGQSYITGGDPRPATRRRIRIYEKESGVKAKKKSVSCGGFVNGSCISYPLVSRPLDYSESGVMGDLNLSAANQPLQDSYSAMLLMSAMSQNNFISESSSTTDENCHKKSECSRTISTDNLAEQSYQQQLQNTVLFGSSDVFNAFAATTRYNSSNSSYSPNINTETSRNDQMHVFKKIKIEPQFPPYDAYSGVISIDLDDIVIPEAPILECLKYH